MGKKWIKNNHCFFHLYLRLSLNGFIFYDMLSNHPETSIQKLSVKIKRNKLSAITEMMEDEINFSFLFTRTWIGDPTSFFSKMHIFYLCIFLYWYSKTAVIILVSLLISIIKKLIYELLVLAITEYWRVYYFHLYQISNRHFVVQPITRNEFIHFTQYI